MRSPNKNNRAIPGGTKRRHGQEKMPQTLKKQINCMEPIPTAKVRTPRPPPIQSSADESEEIQPAKIIPSSTVAIQQQLEDGHADLADVDSRLQALQDFLRMAKASAASTDE